MVPKSIEISVYDFKFDPEVESNNRRLIKYYMRIFRSKLEKEIGNFVTSGWMIFATKKKSNITLIEEDNKKEIKMEIRYTKRCLDLNEIMS